MISEEANQMEEEEEKEEEEKEKSEMNYPKKKKKNAVCTDGNTVYIFTRECKKKNTWDTYTKNQSEKSKTHGHLSKLIKI